MQFSSDDDRVRAGVREWLLRDPLASWRRIIDQLYIHNEAERADGILHYAEELTGMYMIINYDSYYTTPHDAWEMFKVDSHWSTYCSYKN